MERNNEFFRHVLLHYFDLKKSAAEAYKLLLDAYGEAAPSERTCRKWMQRFKEGDIDVQDKKRSGQPKKFDDEELQELLNENPAQTLKELSVALGVDKSTISRRLHALGKIQKEGKWVPYQLSESSKVNRLNICVSLLAKHKKRVFYGVSLLATKNGSITIIQNGGSRG